MSALDEFRKLNELVKNDLASKQERTRWAELKRQLIETTCTSTPSGGTVVLSATGTR
jgi:hypothetical protein